MSCCRRYLLLCLLLLGEVAVGAPEWRLYHNTQGAHAAELAKQAQALLPGGVELRLYALPAACNSEQDARLHAAAIADGVSTLPSLALRDAHGAYATLPLRSLSAEQVQQAAELATAPERQQAGHRRTLTARLFLLRFRLSRAADAPAQDTILAHMQELMQAPDTPPDMRQLIGLHCLYPAIMHQYAAEHSSRGAHTPRTEAKLLEAIRVLEAARDTAPDSPLGRRAHAERERLRAARLKSRQYE